MAGIEVVEASIADLRRALERGDTTAVGLVEAHLARIDAYDPVLNAVPVRNPAALDEARAADERRNAGRVLGPLDGIPYTAKESYAVRGLTVAAGSPAFEHLVAQRDAFTIERLRAGGAICLGLTTMPPMANGGMQRGLHGRAESPYDPGFLTAAFASGSSNGSGTATAASFAAFGLGEETWSSGRAPATNNGLVAYTPSRGVISIRGNWPLVPTMDVVVPHTRSVADLLEVLDLIVAPDAETDGDFWREQPWVALPPVEQQRPASYRALAGSLAGLRLGVPTMYIGGDPDIPVRPSVLERWRRTRELLEARGAEVVELELDVVPVYEQGVRGGQQGLVDRGLVPPDYLDRELWDLSIRSWDLFLRRNGDPALHRLADVDGPRIFPHPAGALPDRYGDADLDLAEYVERAKRGVPDLLEIPAIPDGVRGLERAREELFEAQLDARGLDAVVFPAVADVGPADADTNPASADLAWRNGTWVANGNLVIRHLGIPTVTVPMGLMADIGMPIGLTIAGRGQDDVRLLTIAAAMEAEGVTERAAPPRTPPLL
ncbi:amidase [Amnibacterium kyonggiense]|uniref:Amidase n=1 Tax=Amnibacterium kyonggiense TaxID=595671 RepID=A0A4R7FJD7_9MICO|nr:amidase [Amnibacterium kyonggiense]TDS76186.1 amidase [Amnibacterium kyonggiense]